MNGYIKREELIERNLFFRIYYAVIGEINKAASKRLFQNFDTSTNILESISDLDKFYFGYLVHLKIGLPSSNNGARKDKSGFAKLFLMTKLYQPKSIEEYPESIEENLSVTNKIWDEYILSFSEKSSKYHKTYYDMDAQVKVRKFQPARWYGSHKFEEDIIELANKTESV